MNEILQEMHSIRFQNYPEVTKLKEQSNFQPVCTLGSRLLAESICSQISILTVKDFLLLRLIKDENNAIEINNSQRQVQENVEVCILDTYQIEYNTKMIEIIENITDSILYNCIVDASTSCYRLF